MACSPAFVSIEEEDRFTKLSLQVEDYPGLLRVVSWTLNGMDVRVHSAKLTTTDDGLAKDVFHLTSITGQALSKARAKEVAEQVQELVMFCSRPVSHSLEWCNGPVFVSNLSHPKFTELTLLESGKRQGFLLDIASVLSGVGLEVREADIRSCSDCHKDVAVPHLLHGQETPSGRVFKLLVCEPDNEKLTETSVNTVLYVLGLLMGMGHAPTVVPTLTSYAVTSSSD